MSRADIKITDDLAAYVRAVSLRDTGLLKRLREETAKCPDARMQITPEQGQFMALLVHALGVRRALEIGVFTGYSSLCVALALPDEGKLVACDVNAEWTSIARRYWKEAGVDRKVDLRLRPALETLDQMLAEGAAGTFDFAFIDADKANYANYYERALVLLRPGGLILVDNVLWSGRVIDSAVKDKDTAAIRDFNSKLHNDDRIWLSMLPISDGLTLACKK